VGIRESTVLHAGEQLLASLLLAMHPWYLLSSVDEAFLHWYSPSHLLVRRSRGYLQEPNTFRCSFEVRADEDPNGELLWGLRSMDDPSLYFPLKMDEAER